MVGVTGPPPISIGNAYMTDLDPCLAGCDSVLAEAERLLAVLAATRSDEVAFAPIRHSIAKLRREVDRIRGHKVPHLRRDADPFRTQLGGGESPWSSKRSSSTDAF